MLSERPDQEYVPRLACGGLAMTTTDASLSTASLPDGPLARALGENWWLLFLRGIVAVLFGVLAFAWPGLTLLTLVLMWGIFALFDGVFALTAALSGKSSPTAPRWWLIIVGISGIAAGAIAFLRPDFAAQILLLVIAVWAIIIGVSQIVGAIALRKEIDNEWMLLISGLLSLAWGALLVLAPPAGALAIIWLIGAFAILTGASLIALSFRVKRLKPAA
jgi:uncharacterized membrane protein HdeD (DUF308 family)